VKQLFPPKLAHFLSELSARQLLAAAVAAVVSVETSAAGETVASAERTVVAVEETVASVVVVEETVASAERIAVETVVAAEETVASVAEETAVAAAGVASAEV